jgi:hypothetical protein
MGRFVRTPCFHECLPIFLQARITRLRGIMTALLQGFEQPLHLTPIAGLCCGKELFDLRQDRDPQFFREAADQFAAVSAELIQSRGHVFFRRHGCIPACCGARAGERPAGPVIRSAQVGLRRNLIGNLGVVPGPPHGAEKEQIASRKKINNNLLAVPACVASMFFMRLSRKVGHEIDTVSGGFVWNSGIYLTVVSCRAL